MGVRGLVLGAGFGIEVLTDEHGVRLFLSGWRPWMIYAFFGLLVLLGLALGFGLGRRVGRVEGKAAAKRKDLSKLLAGAPTTK